MTPEEKSKIRLQANVSHFAAHAEDHLAEIRALKPAFTDDARLSHLLEHAIDDMQTAKRSLQAVLDALGPCQTPDHGHHAH